jgi:hypothetical protein
VHRDVKPENVLITAGMRSRSRISGPGRRPGGHTKTGTIIGTAAYLAPEQVSQSISDARTDVYATGVMLFELLTGVQPHTGETLLAVAYKHVNEVVPAPSSVTPGCLRPLTRWWRWPPAGTRSCAPRTLASSCRRSRKCAAGCRSPGCRAGASPPARAAGSGPVSRRGCQPPDYRPWQVSSGLPGGSSLRAWATGRQPGRARLAASRAARNTIARLQRQAWLTQGPASPPAAGALAPGPRRSCLRPRHGPIPRGPIPSGPARPGPARPGRAARRTRRAIAARRARPARRVSRPSQSLPGQPTGSARRRPTRRPAICRPAARPGAPAGPGGHSLPGSPSAPGAPGDPGSQPFAGLLPGPVPPADADSHSFDSWPTASPGGPAGPGDQSLAAGQAGHGRPVIRRSVHAARRVGPPGARSRRRVIPMAAIARGAGLPGRPGSPPDGVPVRRARRGCRGAPRPWRPEARQARAG